MENSEYVGDEGTGTTSFSVTPNPNGASKSAEYEEVQIGFRTRNSSLSSIHHDGPYAGMPKEVLLRYSRQKKFVWARNILTAMVLLTILALIALVISIIVISPPCLDYWQTSPIYQVYPKSFKDSYSPNEGEENDGIGDIKGIIEKLDYLEDLGVKVLWLNPIYESPQKDNGYDISDFRKISDTYGGMDAIDDLIVDMHNRGMKLVMDFVPNHSSNQHEWFLQSSNPSAENYSIYKDYYVWKDGTDENDYPNNWVSEFDNTTRAWTWNNERKQFYFHGFYAEQPDLNLKNENVLEELKEILRFWFEKGVDGFRCDALAFMFEAEHLRDNPVIDDTKPVNKDNVYPDYTQNYKGIHDVVADWRSVFNEFSTEPGVYRFMETEVYTDIDQTMRYYGTKRANEADFPMNFLLIDADPDTDWNANSMRSIVLKWMRNMPKGKWPNWIMSNHDNSRLPSKVGLNLARSAAVMIMTLPGTPGIYYGDEIGMTDNNDIEDQMDFRDPERTPMQWSNEANAGFCTDCEPWLPVNENYETVNVEDQMIDPSSTLNMYKDLISLRQETVYQRGYLCMLDVPVGSDTLAYVRELPGLGSKMVLINFGSSSRLSLDYSLKDGKVSFTSDEGKVAKNSRIEFSAFDMPEATAIVVDFEPGSKSFHEMTEDDSIECFIHTKVCWDRGLGIVKTC